jgi:MFS transporter, DHA2 family, multidrug resistance protein
MSQPHAEPPHINPWIVGMAVMICTFMEVLDTTVVNVSLPHIAGSLSATIDESTWVLTSYLVANAIILPLTGWLAAYFGRKRLLMLSIIGFTAASFLCGLAPSLKFLIICRIIQGLSGGTMQPMSQAIMLESFPPEDRGKAMGFWGLGIVVAPILGPVIGGWLTDSYSWRWVFYINLPVGLAALIMNRLFIFDPAYLRRRSMKVDYWGIGLLALAVAALQIMLDKGQEEDWFSSDFIVSLAVIAVVALIAFLIWEIRASDPVIHLKVFLIRTYSAGVLLITCIGFVLYGSLVLLPIFLQTVLGYPSLQAGIALAPRGIGSFIAMPLIGILLSKGVGPRKLLAGGLAGGALTMYWFSQLNLNAGYWDIFWPQFLQGFALGLLFVPLTTITMDPIPREEMGNATSLYSFMRNIGSSFGVATITTLLARHQQMYTNVLGANVTPYSPKARILMGQMQSAFVGAGADPATAAQRANAALFGMVQRHAAALSFIEQFGVLAIVFLILMPLLLIMKNPRRRGAGPPPAAH